MTRVLITGAGGFVGRHLARDLTAAEKAFIEDGANGLDGLFTMVRRDASGALRAVPYSEHFAAPLQRAAALLRS